MSKNIGNFRKRSWPVNLWYMPSNPIKNAAAKKAETRLKTRLGVFMISAIIRNIKRYSMVLKRKASALILKRWVVNEEVTRLIIIKAKTEAFRLKQKSLFTTANVIIKNMTIRSRANNAIGINIPGAKRSPSIAK